MSGSLRQGSAAKSEVREVRQSKLRTWLEQTRVLSVLDCLSWSPRVSQPWFSHLRKGKILSPGMGVKINGKCQGQYKGDVCRKASRQSVGLTRGLCRPHWGLSSRKGREEAQVEAGRVTAAEGAGQASAASLCQGCGLGPSCPKALVDKTRRAVFWCVLL